MTNPLRLPVATLLLFATLATSASATDRPPNVILILADDLAVGDLHMGDDKPNCAPNLAKFAAQSVRFENAYSGSPVCAPARAALLTGRYPHRTGAVTLNNARYPERVRLFPRERTAGDHFRAADFTTGLIGKWHLGRTPDHMPHSRGFDHTAVFLAISDDYFKYRWDVNGEKQPGDGQYLSVALNQRAIRFVRKHHDERFFLHLAHFAPHRPLSAYKKIIDSYRDRGYDENTATIYAMVQQMDQGLGRLFDTLDELGIADDTIVIFTSDNGPDPLTGQRYNANLRGTKYMINEGGIRVPFFVRYPRRVTPGTRRSPVHFVDVLPTLMDLCDVGAVADAPPMDGESFADVLTADADDFSPPRYWQWNRVSPDYAHNAALRDGDHKLVRPYVTRNKVKPTERPLPPRLYDLSSDPGEEHDLAPEQPDRVAEMNARLSDWSESVESDRQQGIATDPTPKPKKRKVKKRSKKAA